jgi:hypothetical protein
MKLRRGKARGAGLLGQDRRGDPCEQALCEDPHVPAAPVKWSSKVGAFMLRLRCGLIRFAGRVEYVDPVSSLAGASGMLTAQTGASRTRPRP